MVRGHLVDLVPTFTGQPLGPDSYNLAFGCPESIGRSASTLVAASTLAANSPIFWAQTGPETPAYFAAWTGECLLQNRFSEYRGCQHPPDVASRVWFRSRMRTAPTMAALRWRVPSHPVIEIEVAVAHCSMRCSHCDSPVHWNQHG